MEEVKRLFNHVDKLRAYFKNQKSIPIVLNLEFPKTIFKTMKLIKTLETAVKELKLNENYKEYNIMPQTMPPFPWHQGGRNSNLPPISKIKEFLDATDNYICLDIFLTALSCEYFKSLL